MNKRKFTFIALALLAVMSITAVVYAAVIDSINRTVTTANFFLDGTGRTPNKSLTSAGAAPQISQMVPQSQDVPTISNSLGTVGSPIKKAHLSLFSVRLSAGV